MNPILLEVLIKERHREMLAEAEKQKLIKSYNDSINYKRATLMARFYLTLGDFLIHLGKRLKSRYTPHIKTVPQLYCR